MIIKVCGMCEPDNIRQTAALGVDWIGFIFYKKSPRQLTINTQNLLNCQLSTVNCQLKKVGVFVNASIKEIQETALQYGLDYLQLHGKESPDICLILQKQKYKIIKAISINSIEDLEQAGKYIGAADYFLFDTKCKDYGGSGKSFDWSILQSYKENIPFLLSGGIQPESIEAIKNFHHPQWAGIDLNSGFEIKPGLKDIGKLENFIKKIRK